MHQIPLAKSRVRAGGHHSPLCEVWRQASELATFNLQALAASMAGPAGRAPAAAAASPPLMPGAGLAAASSNGTTGAAKPPAPGDQSNVRVDPLGRPTSIDKEHQVTVMLLPAALSSPSDQTAVNLDREMNSISVMERRLIRSLQCCCACGG